MSENTVLAICGAILVAGLLALALRARRQEDKIAPTRPAEIPTLVKLHAARSLASTQRERNAEAKEISAPEHAAHYDENDTHLKQLEVTVWELIKDFEHPREPSETASKIAGGTANMVFDELWGLETTFQNRLDELRNEAYGDLSGALKKNAG